MSKTKFNIDECRQRAMSRFKDTALQSRVLRAEEDALRDFSNLLAECESPIEMSLLTAMFDNPSFDGFAFTPKQHHRFFFHAARDKCVCAQFQIDRFRCDFALTVQHPYGTRTKIVIECDGHDYHERTKEQARRDRSRDRLMTADGWRVLRFTGSEIHRDADACVEEIASIIENDSIDDWRSANG